MIYPCRQSNGEYVLVLQCKVYYSPCFACHAVLALLGWLVPYIRYDHSPRQSIVEELRDSQKHCRPLSFWAEDDFQFRYILRIMSLYYVAAIDNPKEC